MKLSEMINLFQELQRQHGDLEVMASNDQELDPIPKPILMWVKPGDLPILCLKLGIASQGEQEQKSRQEDVKFLDQTVLLAFYEGRRNGETGGGQRNFNPEELRKIKTEWPIYEELARFYLSQLGSMDDAPPLE